MNDTISGMNSTYSFNHQIMAINNQIWIDRLMNDYLNKLV